MSKFVASEVKARKSNKEKLKAVIDSMDDKELEEVGSTLKSSQLPFPQTNSRHELEDVSQAIQHM